MNKITKMYYPDGVKEILQTSVKADRPALLVGPTGCGKTHAIRELAAEHNKQLFRISLNGQSSIDEILGKWIPKGADKGFEWIDGLVIRAMKAGDWIVLDEVNAALPEILFTLHSLLDDDKCIVLKEKEGEIIKPHSEFRLFASMNPDDEYAGTKELNKAFLSRFPIVMQFTYSSQEADILIERSGADEDLAGKLVMVANSIREEKEKGQLSYECSTRDLIFTCDFIKDGLDKFAAIQLCILNKAPKDEREKIKKIFELMTGENITFDFSSSSSKEKMKFTSLGEIRKYVEEAKAIREKGEEEVKKEKEKAKAEVTKYKNIADESSAVKSASLQAFEKYLGLIIKRYKISDEDKTIYDEIITTIKANN